MFERTGYLAGSVDRRRREWVEAWLRPENRAILAARGGAGANQLLPLDDADLPNDRRPVFSGFSDLTYLHAALARRRRVTFYGPMVAWDIARGDASPGGYDAELFHRLLFSGEPGGVLAPTGMRTIRPGAAEGRLAGGCLSLLSAMWGTPEEPDLQDTVLVLEDEKESPYRIERFLVQLQRGGAFESVRAVVLGEFPDCAPHPPGSATALEVCSRFFADFPGPVLWNVPIGHTARPNLTIPLGTAARVDGEAGSIELLEPAVTTK